MPKINRNGVNIHFETYGNGPAIFLTHGFSDNLGIWKNQIKTLSKNNTLILWDLKGHGNTDAPDDMTHYSEEETILDMLEILNHLNIKKASIGGFSLGGYMSLAFYRKYPERVSSLLIIDTGPGFKNDEAREAWNKYAIKSAEKYEIRNRHGIGNAARGMLTQKDDRIIKSLPDISVPTLIIVGEEDKPFLSAADYMNSKIKNSQKNIIPNAGHAVNIEQPELFNSAVLDFLKI
ncbi:MAG: alpha/beta fold hydrolase [Hyphomicrobiales bacterium]|nr:alpha/beta fold hydrolase [Hyphomicrobiales bacterium]